MAPPVFADLAFVDAVDRARAERKLLLVDATAAWCGPCKMMDRTTWLDPAVVAWLGEHAIAIQIDVDANKNVAGELRIKAMPTIIAFVDGTEFDRVVGAKKPKELLGWLGGVLRGETALVVPRARVIREPADMLARLAVARELRDTGRYDEALVEHVWLWEHMLEHDPAMHGVRRSFFARDLEMLVNAHAPSRAAISEARDRAAPQAAGPIDVESFRDWACLNRVLGDPGRELAWYDALPAASRERLGPHLEHDLIPLLIAAKRWAEAGAMYDEPLAILDDAVERVARTAELVDRPEVVRYARDHVRTKAEHLVRALRAAGRSTEADAVDRRAREADPSDEMTHALDAARSE